jgi:hypothetical protein
MKQGISIITDCNTLPGLIESATRYIPDHHVAISGVEREQRQSVVAKLRGRFNRVYDTPSEKVYFPELLRMMDPEKPSGSLIILDTQDPDSLNVALTARVNPLREAIPRFASSGARVLLTSREPDGITQDLLNKLGLVFTQLNFLSPNSASARRARPVIHFTEEEYDLLRHYAQKTPSKDSSKK